MVRPTGNLLKFYSISFTKGSRDALEVFLGESRGNSKGIRDDPQGNSKEPLGV